MPYAAWKDISTVLSISTELPLGRWKCYVVALKLAVTGEDGSDITIDTPADIVAFYEAAIFALWGLVALLVGGAGVGGDGGLDELA